MILTASHPIDPVQRKEGYGFGKPVSIGDNVWIGAGTIINPGIHVGSNTVIGSGSVVTYSIPSNVVAAGNPCEVIHPILNNINELDRRRYVFMCPPPKLSVVIPAFNCENYLIKCLDSVFNQSLKDIQVIVVDDGSSDKTYETALIYKKMYPNLTVIHHSDNLGTGTARNIGLSHADGLFVSFLDADDWMDTNAYLEMTMAIESTGADIALCGIRTEYESPFSSKIRYSYPHSNLITSKFALNLLSRSRMQDTFISPMVGNKMFRRTLLHQHPLAFPQRSLFEDDEFMFLAFCYANNVVFVPNIYQHYYQRVSSAMHSFSTKNIDCMLSAFQSIREQLTSESRYEEYSVEYFAFLEKCISSLLDTLFDCEQRLTAQRQYMTYLIEHLLQLFTIQELTAHIEPCRLRRVWL